MRLRAGPTFDIKSRMNIHHIVDSVIQLLQRRQQHTRGDCSKSILHICVSLKIQMKLPRKIVVALRM